MSLWIIEDLESLLLTSVFDYYQSDHWSACVPNVGYNLFNNWWLACIHTDSAAAIKIVYYCSSVILSLLQTEMSMPVESVLTAQKQELVQGPEEIQGVTL